jgi:hypothetical protein
MTVPSELLRSLAYGAGAGAAFTLVAEVVRATRAFVTAFFAGLKEAQAERLATCWRCSAYLTCPVCGADPKP